MKNASQKKKYKLPRVWYSRNDDEEQEWEMPTRKALGINITWILSWRQDLERGLERKVGYVYGFGKLYGVYVPVYVQYMCNIYR